MSDGLTYAQSAAILGCHFSNVAKLIRKGDLTSRENAELPWIAIRSRPRAWCGKRGDHERV